MKLARMKTVCNSIYRDARIDLLWFRGSTMRLALILCLTVILDGCWKSRTAKPVTISSASPVSATLSPAENSAQMFTAKFRDPNGGSHIAEVTLSVMSDNIRPGSKSRWSANECLVRYDIPTNAIWLVPNLGGTWGPHPILAGSPSTFGNSQCTVVASGSSAQITGDTATVNVELKFAPEFAGVKQLYTATKDLDGNWNANPQQFGSFTIAKTGTQ